MRIPVVGCVAKVVEEYWKENGKEEVEESGEEGDDSKYWFTKDKIDYVVKTAM